MNTLRKWVRNALGFSGREVNGFLILLPLMVVVIAIVPLYTRWIIDRADDFSAEAKVLDSLIAFWETPPPDTPAARAVTRLFFHFDPNLAPEADLKRLGFTAALSKRIANYRLKGGQFRVKADLLKIYGMDSSFYTQLHAYILLPEKIADKRAARPLPVKPAGVRITAFDLNAADTSRLKSIAGIGSVLAARIIKFRDGLGGFVHRRQVSEVYGLDSTTVERLWKVAFIADNFMPRRIELNRAAEEEFAAHPYIKRAVARAIVTYRFQHGPFRDVNELGRIGQLSPADIERILPYLTLGE